MSDRNPSSVIAIIQARMGSSRLRGKVLADIAGHPMLWHVVERVQQAQTVDFTVVATSTNVADDEIVRFCEGGNIPVFRGSESDVLDRYYQTARQLEARVVVRITADCPLIDPEVIDQVVKAFQTQDCDYATNILVRTFPHGLDTEVFSFGALETAWREGRRAADREHVTSYFRSSGRFRSINVDSGLASNKNYYRWTVDEPCDLQFIREVFLRMKPRIMFGWRQVLEMLHNCPELTKINCGPVCDEGYFRSLALESVQPICSMTSDRAMQLRRRLKTYVAIREDTVLGGAPLIGRASGASVWDADDNEFIDLKMGHGQIILGHGYPCVDEAIQRTLERGLGDDVSPQLLADGAERLETFIPHAEMVYFAPTVADARLAAVAFARSYRGRELVITSSVSGIETGQEGCEPNCVPTKHGVVSFQKGDMDSVCQIFRQHAEKIAALIVKPCDLYPVGEEFLRLAYEACQQYGTLLILDETDGSLRLANGGAQSYFGVNADLVCRGPSSANGYCFAAVSGPRKIFKGTEPYLEKCRTKLSSVSIAAAISTLQAISEGNVIAHIWEQGRKLKDGLLVLARQFGATDRIRLSGPPPCFNITFTDGSGKSSSRLEKLFAEECLRRGILFGPRQRPSYSHGTPEIDQTLRVYRAAMELIGNSPWEWGNHEHERRLLSP